MCLTADQKRKTHSIQGSDDAQWWDQHMYRREGQRGNEQRREGDRKLAQGEI